MAATDNTYEQVYNIKEDETLPSRVALVICLVMQRGVMAAGFSITKELLTIHYSGYSAGKPVWDLGFFEQVLSHEPLLMVKEKVKGVFVSSSSNMVVPEDLFAQKDAEKWLRHLHHIAPDDTIRTDALKNDKAQYLYALPLKIAELIKISFKKTPILPLPLYHFNAAQQQSLYLQCCISSEQVVATLHNYSQLLWHKVLDYSCAEDIAYEIKLLCSGNNIDAAKLNIACNTTGADGYDLVNDLTQYFPAIKAGNGRTIHARWEPAISLAHQLLECV